MNISKSRRKIAWLVAITVIAAVALLAQWLMRADFQRRMQNQAVAEEKAVPPPDFDVAPKSSPAHSSLPVASLASTFEQLRERARGGDASAAFEAYKVAATAAGQEVFCRC